MMRYVSLLQIGGTLAVIAFHVGLPGSSAGWIAVILFFVLAGRNMARVADRTDSVFDYAASRIRRTAPELSIIWCLVALVSLSGLGTRGADWFLVSSPVFLQNLTLPLFEYQFPADWVFGPLWFVAALVQLQVIVYLFRRVLVARPPWVVVVTAVTLGTAFRWLAALALGGSASAVDARVGNILYCLPLTHIEAITLGFLVGRGSLAGLGRQLPAVATLTLALGLLNAALSGQPLASFGLEFPFRTAYIHVWGYCLFAFAAASLCSPHNPIAVRVQSMALEPRLHSAISKVASLSYGAYAFHGLLLAVLTTPSEPFRQFGTRPVGFLVVVVGSFLLAAAALSARRAMEAGTQRVFKRLA